MRISSLVILSLAATVAIALASSANGALNDTPPCPDPSDACPEICIASPGIESNTGSGTPAEIAALCGSIDISVTYGSGPGDLCNGTAKTEGCDTCSECWESVNASYLNHGGGAYESRIGTSGFPGAPWSGASTYGRSGFLRSKCADFAYLRIEVQATGGGQVLYSEGVTIICGGC